MHEEHPQFAEKKRFGLNRGRLLLVGLLVTCTLCLVVCGQVLCRNWLENRLKTVGVEYAQLSMELLRAEIVLTDVVWTKSKQKLRASTIHVYLNPSMVWTQTLEGVHVAMGKTRVHVSPGAFETSVQTVVLDQNRTPRFKLDKLAGLTLSWSELEVRLQHESADCNLRLPTGKTTLMAKSPVTFAQQMELSCVASDHILETSLNLDMSSFPVAIRVRRDRPLKVSKMSAELDFEQAELTVLPKLKLRVENIRAATQRFEITMPEIELWRVEGTIHALAHGGMIGYSRGQQVTKEKRDDQTPRFTLREYPSIHLDWFGVKLRLDGQQVTHIRHLDIKPNAVGVSLTRGDSSLFVSLTGGRRGWGSSTLAVTGHLELADIDMLWPPNAMIDGTIGVDAQYQLKSGEATVALQSERIRVLHPSLSMMPFHLPKTQTRLFGSYRLGERGGSLTGTFKMGQLSTRLTAALGEEGERFNFRWMSDEVPCEVLSSVLPIEWVEQLNVNFRGTAQPLITLVGERTQLAQLRLRLRGIVERCRVASVLVPWAKTGIDLVQNGQRLPISSTADVDVLNQRFTKVIDPTYTNGARIRVGPGTSQYTRISALPRYVSAIMFLSEEVGFYKNLAVDLGLIQRALGLDLSHGRYVYGGSTITQQLVKNLILDRRKTLRRKFHEMLVADRVYQRVPKERVLELYVNVIEFGPGIFGIEAAAEFYFQKSASELSINESIFLAMLKPDPTRGVAYVRRGRTPLHEYWFTRSEQLLGRLVEYGYVLGNKAEDLPPLELFWSAGDSVAKPTEK